jgi:hypothetical protein
MTQALQISAVERIDVLREIGVRRMLRTVDHNRAFANEFDDMVIHRHRSLVFLSMFPSDHSFGA